MHKTQLDSNQFSEFSDVFKTNLNQSIIKEKYKLGKGHNFFNQNKQNLGQ